MGFLSFWVWDFEGWIFGIGDFFKRVFVEIGLKEGIKISFLGVKVRG